MEEEGDHLVDLAWTPKEIEEVDYLMDLTEKPVPNENDPIMTPQEVEDEYEKQGDDDITGHVNTR
jgi:hypothetical protein